LFFFTKRAVAEPLWLGPVEYFIWVRWSPFVLDNDNIEKAAVYHEFAAQWNAM